MEGDGIAQRRGDAEKARDPNLRASAPRWEYSDVAGFCKSATTAEIAAHGYVLTPGRYVGAEEVADDGDPFRRRSGENHRHLSRMEGDGIAQRRGDAEMARDSNLRASAPRREYSDVAGFCKSATTAEIAAHGHVLRPGRYVGAEEVADDGDPFEEKMPRLVAELHAQFAESAKLEQAIKANPRGRGYPPDLQEEAVKTVLAQAKLLCAEWV
jgi:type I restriction-modification system DNA methylase subunit